MYIQKLGGNNFTLEVHDNFFSIEMHYKLSYYRNSLGMIIQ